MMSEHLGNLYVRAESEDDPPSTASSTPKKSTSLSSLRSLRDTFRRSESNSSQLSSQLVNNGTDGSPKKPG